MVPIARRRYQINTVESSLDSTVGYVRILGANSQRTSLLFAVSGSGLFQMSNRQLPTGEFGFVQIGNINTTNLSYNDWGPVIQGEIWVANLSVTTRILKATETYYIGR